jgi:hypothetical protein
MQPGGKQAVFETTATQVLFESTASVVFQRSEDGGMNLAVQVDRRIGAFMSIALAMLKEITGASKEDLLRMSDKMVG